MGLWKTKLQQTHPQAEIMKKYMRAQGMQNKMHFPPLRDNNHSQKVPDMAATEGAYMLARAGNKERGEKGMNECNCYCRTYRQRIRCRSRLQPNA